MAFAFSPAAAVAAQYNMAVMDVTLIQYYIFYLTTTYIAPGFESGTLGPFLGNTSGGLITERTVYQWLYGTTTAFPVPEQHPLPPAGLGSASAINTSY